MGIEIMNLRDLDPEVRRFVDDTEWNVRIDRGHSVLSNKYKIGVDGTREEVIEKYQDWLTDKLIVNDKPVVKELLRLRGLLRECNMLKLWCWCAPEACHGDVIKRYVL